MNQSPQTTGWESRPAGEWQRNWLDSQVNFATHMGSEEFGGDGVRCTYVRCCLPSTVRGFSKVLITNKKTRLWWATSPGGGVVWETRSQPHECRGHAGEPTLYGHEGERNGAYVSGSFTLDAVAERRAFTLLLSECRTGLIGLSDEE